MHNSNVLRQIKIEAELSEIINNLAEDLNLTLIELHSIMVNWYIKERSEGELSLRAFIPAVNNPLRSLWLEKEADIKLSNLSIESSHPVNRLLYTAIVRYLLDKGLICE